MGSPVTYMNVIRYYRDARPSTTETTNRPTWTQVEAAIRRMENYCYPIVQLGCGDAEDDEDSFNVIGGDGRLALFHFMGDWQFEDDSGDEAETRLWDRLCGRACRSRCRDRNRADRSARAWPR